MSADLHHLAVPLLVVLVLLLAAITGLANFAELVNKRSDPWKSKYKPNERDEKIAAAAVSDASAVARLKESAAREVPRQNPFDCLFEKGPDCLECLRTLFKDLSRAQNVHERQTMFAGLAEKLRLVRLITDDPALELLSKLAAALQGLFDQIASRPPNSSPSALRTAAEALLILESYCAAKARVPMRSVPAPKFLVVDDDKICRAAVAASLKKAFELPDVAEDGTTAVSMAEKNSYDAVFLDIEMPGIDGYETCARIQKTHFNRDTPVVFVTSHSDFESRAKSTSVGGRDFIAKPFLSFEVTVKALVLLVQGGQKRAKSPAPRRHLSPITAALAVPQPASAVG